jgi:transcriptional regulator with XRE-family HTH domain
MADTHLSTVGPTGLMLAENIRRIRTMRAWTYVDLAARLAAAGRPIPVLGLRRLEHGERRADADDLTALAAVFGVGVQQLLDAPSCADCGSAPPAGYTCNTCGLRPASDPPRLRAVYHPTMRRMSHEEFAGHQEMREMFAPFLDAAYRDAAAFGQAMATLHEDVPATFKPQELQP